MRPDYNVTPLGPLRMVQDAVTRIMADGGDVFFADERVSPDLALRGVTIDAAYQCRMDDICGSLNRPGFSGGPRVSMDGAYGKRHESEPLPA